MSDITAHLASLSDSDLLDAIRMAYEDMNTAAVESPNTEWHEACFAGLVVYVGEAERRGLTISTLQ